MCSVPSVFSCIYRRLDRDNKVKNYLCYLIPHTTKSLIFPNALLFIPAIITCMELFVCPHNHESSLTTIRLVCITKVFQEYATFMMISLFGESIDSSVDISLTLIVMRIHWPTPTIIKVPMVLQ